MADNRSLFKPNKAFRETQFIEDEELMGEYAHCKLPDHYFERLLQKAAHASEQVSQYNNRGWTERRFRTNYPE